MTINRKRYRTFFNLLLGIVVFNGGCATEPSIIPITQQISFETGTITIDSSTKIHLASENKGL